MRLFPAALALVLATLPASAREISGKIAYSMRLALPPETQMVVELSPQSGQATVLRQTTRGAQVPLPFALSDETGGPLTLRAALFIDGRPLWTSGPLPVASGSDDIDLGTIQLDPFLALGLSARLDCGGDMVEAGFLDQTARLRIKGKTYVLTETQTTRGRRYSDGATPETALRSQSGTVRVTVQGRSLPECTALMPANLLPLRASGTEPFWSLTASHDGLTLETPDAPAVKAPLPPAETGADSITFTAEDLGVTLQDQLCRNDKTGMPYPLSVTVRHAGTTLTGCGGDPAALLDGAWQAISVGGKALRGGASVTFAFTGGQISGQAACNRFSGGLSLTGESLSFGPLVATRMACAPVLMQAESAAFAALSATTGFDIDASGNLVLTGPSGPLLVATR